MKFQPILPMGALVAGFALLFVLTTFLIINNKANRADKIGTLVRLTLIYALAFSVGARPCIVESQYEFATKNLDVLFVIDNTISMWAQDYNGSHTRMSGVTADVNYIIDELAGSNFGLVTFDDSAHVLAPFTQDMEYIRNLMDTFSMPDSYYAKGSDLSIPYQDIEALLLSSQKKENRKTIVFYISDGEITNGKQLKDYSGLAQYIDAGAVMGYGSVSGGKMKDSYSFVYDYTTHGDAISRINEGNLKTIAEQLGLEYENMNSGSESLKGRIQIIKETSKTVIESGQGAEITRDLYYYFAIPLVLMILIELFMIARRGRL
ncbi:MAG: VWA domain-containing protein [Butyrivibrio sp.]|nr:VWA domain-containing protein [Butyrivibrio sp.]